MARMPEYQRVYQSLKKMIKNGEYPVQTLLPTEPELEEIYKVSRTTIRRAIDLLVRDKLLAVTQGRGTEVLDFTFHQNLSGISSVSQTLTAQGFKVESKKIFVDRVKADDYLAANLQLEPGSELIRVQRIQTADDIPIAYMTNYIMAEKVDGIEEHLTALKSFYSFLENQYQLVVEASVDQLSAVNADFSQAEMLGVETGAALLVMDRVTYCNKRPLTFDRSIIRADRYQFKIDLRGYSS